MVLENILNENVWYNMDYGVTMHEFFLNILEPESLSYNKMCTIKEDFVYIVGYHPQRLDMTARYN